MLPVPWSVTSTPCQPVRVWDGEPVGLVAVVSTLDTLPAVSLCRGLCRSDGEPVACGGQFPRWCWLSVSDGVPVDWWPLDVLPVCEPVRVCRGVCVDVLPVVVSSLGGAGCRCRMVCHSSSGEGVGCVACGGQFPRWCCVSVGWSATVPAVRVSDGEPVGCAACGQFPRHIASL